MKLNGFIFITVILSSYLNFRTQTGFVDINYQLNEILDRMKQFLPISLMINAIEQYQTNTKELAFELEACYLNLKGTIFFEQKDDFIEHQKICLANYLEFFSIFEIMRSMVFKFFSDTCPDELVETCTNFIEEFDIQAQLIEDKIYSFMNMLLSTDVKMETMDPLLSEAKANGVETVVMKSLTTINQESFYNQLNEVLQKQNERTVLDQPSLGPKKNEDDNEDEDSVLTPIRMQYTVPNTIQDDPIQNPDHYLLEDPDKESMSNQYIVFNSEDDDNTINLVKL